MQRTLAVLLTVVIATAAVAPIVAVGADAQDTDPECDYPLEITDASGETVTIDEEPEEVVTLYPGDAQLAYAIGAEDRVVGMPVGQYTDSLEAGDRTDITEDDGATVDTEQVIALDPDVVLAANVAPDDLVQDLEDAGITVVTLDTAESIDDVHENVRIAGEVTGECEGAEETNDWMDERLDVVEDALEEEDAPLAYYDSHEDGNTFGDETFQHDVLTAAGLENLAAEAGEVGWTTMSAEEVIAEDPEWIVYPDDEPAESDESPRADSFSETTAYQDDNVLAVDDNQMSQPGPDVVYAIETIVENVHPEVYEEIEGDLEAVDEEYGIGESDDESDEESEDDTIPGFGVPAVIAAALVAAGFLARRR